MALEETIRLGFLYIPPQNFLRKTWLKRYCALYDASNQGVQRLELFENEETFTKQISSKIIPLVDCWKVTPVPQKQQDNVFEVRTKSSCHQFSTDTFLEMSEWLVALQSVAFSKTHIKSLSPLISINEEKQEENLLYCSMNNPEVYPVIVIETEGASRNNLNGEYMLIITSVNVSIAEECSRGRIGKIILTWPYRHIRRYGCSPESFSFEAGRKCVSGEGVFAFATNDGRKIFQVMDSHVSTLKSTQEDFTISNSPTVKEDKTNMFNKDFLNLEEITSNSVNKARQLMYINSGDNNIQTAVTKDQTAFKRNFKSLPPFEKPPRKYKPNVRDSSHNMSLSHNTNVQASSSPVTQIPNALNRENNLSISDLGTQSRIFDFSSSSDIQNCDMPELPCKIYNSLNSSSSGHSISSTLSSLDQSSGQFGQVCDIPKHLDCEKVTSISSRSLDNIPTLSSNTDLSPSNQESQLFYDTEFSVNNCNDVSKKYQTTDFADKCYFFEKNTYPKSSQIAPESNPLNITDVANVSQLNSSFQGIKINYNNEKDSKIKRACSTLDYENCFSSKKTHITRASSAEHVHDKLFRVDNTAPTCSNNVYGKIKSSSSANSSPVYGNILFKKFGFQFSESENDTQHFMKNDAEYAQVLKKNKKMQ